MKLKRICNMKLNIEHDWIEMHKITYLNKVKVSQTLAFSPSASSNTYREIKRRLI